MGKLRGLENLVVDNNRLGWLPSELETHKCLIEGIETNAFVRESVKRKVCLVVGESMCFFSGS